MKKTLDERIKELESKMEELKKNPTEDNYETYLWYAEKLSYLKWEYYQDCMEQENPLFQRSYF